MSGKLSSWRPDIARAREKLDALPDRAVVIDAYGDAWQKSRYLDFWYRAFDGDGIPASTLAQNIGVVKPVHPSIPSPDVRPKNGEKP
jgi:hypothetical protein